MIRLYTLAGLTDDAESFTKSDIVAAIIAAREDLASLPPSSPPGRGSSDYSSDDAIVPDDDEVVTPMPNHLRRRVTVNNVNAASKVRPVNKSRSLSLGNKSSFASSSRQVQTRPSFFLKLKKFSIGEPQDDLHQQHRQHLHYPSLHPLHITYVLAKPQDLH